MSSGCIWDSQHTMWYSPVIDQVVIEGDLIDPKNAVHTIHDARSHLTCVKINRKEEWRLGFLDVGCLRPEVTIAQADASLRQRRRSCAHYSYCRQARLQRVAYRACDWRRRCRRRGGRGRSVPTSLQHTITSPSRRGKQEEQQNQGRESTPSMTTVCLDERNNSVAPDFSVG